ncbi:MAG: baeRF10 domain-containing protein [Gemmatimonadaceae bacterium]
MLTYNDLVDLGHALGGQAVLSAYVNGEEKDPAKRRRWRIELRNSLDDIESWLAGSSHSDREAFATCRRLLLERLGAIRGMIRSPGWAGFFTTDGEHHAGPVPAAVPTMAVWSTGPCLTPYVRALKEERPVFVVVADSRKARLFRYVEHKADLIDTLRAKATVERPSHMSAPPKPGFHSGTRGATGADAAQRELREGTMHMLGEVVERTTKLATDSAWVVIGGIPSVATALLARLPADIAPRAQQAPRLDVHATKADVAKVARESASALRDAVDLERIDEALASAASDRLGVRGSLETQRALEQGRVRDLYFTAAFLENNAADAEAAVRMALGTHAQVEQVSGVAAARLDEVGGIAARLRYALAPEVAAQATSELRS